MPDHTDVGIEPQSFVDDAVIVHRTRCDRVLRPAVKHAGNPVLSTAGSSFDSQSLLYDPVMQTYRCWYVLLTRKTPWLLRYATSSDGITWDTPDLGLHGDDDLGLGNVLADTNGEPVPCRARIFVNPNAGDSDPQRRYIGLFQRWHFVVGYSPDGIHWTIDDDHVAWERGSGDGLGECFYVIHDPRIERWRAYVRVWVDNNSVRTSGYGESVDMTSWTGPTVQYVADERWGPGAQVYSWAAWYDRGLYWAMPHIYYTDLHPQPRWQQTMHLPLLYSRDGMQWEAVDYDRDFIELNDDLNAFDSEMMTLHYQPVVHEDRLMFFYQGVGRKHDVEADNEYPSGLGFATMEPGRYVAMSARSGEEAVLLIRPFRMQGDQLVINARCHDGGHVRAEFLNHRGQTVDTLDAAASCDPFTGDALDHVMTWGGKSSVRRILGETVYLRFRFTDAELFGFRIAESEPGTVALSSGPPPLVCRRTSMPPVIDGDLQDEVWIDFTVIGATETFVYHNRVEAAPVKSTVYITYDEQALYMAMSLDEPNMDRLVLDRTEVDLDIFRDDSLQVDLQPAGMGTLVSSLIFSAKGVRAHINCDPKRSHSTSHVRQFGWEVGVRRASARWTAELRVPFAALGVAAPASGDTWRLNMHRFRYACDEPEIHSWHCIFGNFSNDESRGELRFD